MPFLRRYALGFLFLLLAPRLFSAPAPTTVRIWLADAFDEPVGKPDAEGYYTSRGFRANYHMGEDWNGLGGGNTDLGKPVYAIGNGIVVFARDMHMSWGNLVIIRHIFVEEGQLKTIDSVYAHMDEILVHEHQQVSRGQQVGTIGTAHGMYAAHLHFEVRKNLHIGFNQRGFPKDLSSYYLPSPFIASHRKLSGKGRSALVTIDTFDQQGGDQSFGQEASPAEGHGLKFQGHEVAQPAAAPTPRPAFRVNRFDDLLSF